MDGDGQPFPYLDDAFYQTEGQFSPDGRWVAYISNESGRFEVYVQPFPVSGEKWKISMDGGAEARWRRDGKEIFYLAPDRTLMSVRIKSDGETLEPSAPRPLFQTRMAGPFGGGVRFNYVVSPDGERFLINTELEDSSKSPIIVILDWTAAIEEGTFTP
jgi:hypothetical protein